MPMKKPRSSLPIASTTWRLNCATRRLVTSSLLGSAIGVIGWRVARSIIFSMRVSRGATNRIATPSRPARPVRPMRCT